MSTIVRLVLDKIKASGEVGKLISENLKSGGPIVNIMDLWARWAVKAREIAKAKDITATYLEPRGGGRRDNRGPTVATSTLSVVSRTASARSACAEVMEIALRHPTRHLAKGAGG